MWCLDICSFGLDLMWILQKLVNVTQTPNKLCSGISDAYACGSWSRVHSPSDHFIQGHTNWDVVCGFILNRKSKFRLWLWIRQYFISTVAKNLCSSWFRVPADNMRTKLPEEACQSQNVCCKEDAVSEGHIATSCSQTGSLKYLFSSIITGSLFRASMRWATSHFGSNTIWDLGRVKYM